MKGSRASLSIKRHAQVRDFAQPKKNKARSSGCSHISSDGGGGGETVDCEVQHMVMSPMVMSPRSKAEQTWRRSATVATMDNGSRVGVHEPTGREIWIELFVERLSSEQGWQCCRHVREAVECEFHAGAER